MGRRFLISEDLGRVLLALDDARRTWPKMMPKVSSCSLFALKRLALGEENVG